MSSVDDLDAKAFNVLEAIYENGGEANTTEIKEYTGIQKNAIIHYRYDRLEEAGLITTKTGESTGARVPPKVAVLTDEAQEQIAGGLFDSEDSTIVERMDQLERQFGAVVDQFRNVEQSVRQFSYDEETDEEITAVELVERIEELSELSEEIHEREEDVEDLASLADTVDWAERVLDNHESEILELQDEVGDGSDQLRERVGDIEEAVQQVQQDVDAIRDDLKRSVSNVERRVDVVEEQLGNRSTSLPSMSFVERLKWVLTGDY